MSTTKLITIICWVVVAIVIIGLALWFFTGNLFGFKTGFHISAPAFNIGSFDNLTGPFNEVGSYQVSADGVSSISVDWTSGDISITPYDGDTISLTEYARRELSEKEKLSYNVSNGTLEIKYTSPGLNLNMVSKKLELLVPQSIANELDLLKVNATSAELNISDFSVNTLEIHETSGDSSLQNIKADGSEIHSVSGEIEISNMTSSQLTLGTVSGDIALSGVTADVLTTDTTSGEQELDGTFKSVDAGSVSGEISIASAANPDSMKCGTTSGGITVTIPGGSSISVSYSTTSGRFSSDIPVTTGGSAAYRFTSVSGDIWLKAA